MFVSVGVDKNLATAFVLWTLKFDRMKGVLDDSVKSFSNKHLSAPTGTPRLQPHFLLRRILKALFTKQTLTSAALHRIVHNIAAAFADKVVTYSFWLNHVILAKAEFVFKRSVQNLVHLSS